MEWNGYRRFSSLLLLLLLLDWNVKLAGWLAGRLWLGGLASWLTVFEKRRVFDPGQLCPGHVKRVVQRTRMYHIYIHTIAVMPCVCMCVCLRSCEVRLTTQRATEKNVVGQIRYRVCRVWVGVRIVFALITATVRMSLSNQANIFEPDIDHDNKRFSNLAE